MKFFKSKNTRLVIVIVLALGLRLPLLNGSFWLDEAAQALESARPLSQQLNLVNDFQPPLLHLITFIAIRFSTTEWWLRLIGALVPGLVTIGATYKIGKRLLSHQVGLLAALLLATSSFHVFYSQELRPYSLPTMWAVLGWLTLIAWWQSNKKHFNPQSYPLVFAVITTLGLYSSYLYPFVILAQLVFVILLMKPKIKKVLLSLSGALLLFAPWLPSFWNQLQTGQNMRLQLPGWETVVSLTQLEALPLVFGKFLFGILDLNLGFFYIVISLGFIYLLVILASKNWRRNRLVKQRRAWLVLLTWLVVPLISAWLVSFWIPVIKPKRLLMLLPAFYLLISTLAVSSWRYDKKCRLFSMAKWLVALVLSINIFSLFQYYTQPIYQRENWKDLQSQISAQFPPQKTVLVFSYPHPFSPWVWYDQQTFPTISTGSYQIDKNPDLIQTLKPLNDFNYVLVFDYLRDITDPQDRLLDEVEQFGYLGVGVIEYPHIGFVRIYAKQNTLLGIK